MNILIFSVAAISICTLCSTAPAQIQIAGDCGVNIANVSGDSVVTVEQGICGDAFRVTYVWLDGQSLALIEDGFLTENLERVVGDEPRMVRLGVYPTVRHLLDISTEYVRPNLTTSTPFNVLMTGFETDDTPLDLEPGELNLMRDRTQPLLYYGGDDTIIWPNHIAYSEFYGTGIWPRDVDYCYSDFEPFSAAIVEELLEEEDIDGVLRIITDEIRLLSYLQPSDVASYWSNVNRMLDVMQQNDSNLVLGTHDARLSIWGNGDITANDWERATPPSLTLLRELSAHGFPHDFLLREGRYNQYGGCDGGDGLNFTANPRQMKIMVAVIEPISPAIRITEIQFAADRRSGFGDNFNLRAEENIPVNFPTLLQGESYIIPLRIEFHYDVAAESASSWANRPVLPAEELLVWPIIERILERHPTLSEPAGPNPFGAYLTLAGTRQTQIELPTPTYWYGDVLSIQTITTRNPATGSVIRHSVRPAPQVSVVTNAGVWTGSCPFLLFETADGEMINHGQVLVGASTRELSRTEIVAIPEGARAIHVSEREPEVSYLREVVLISPSTNERTVLASGVQLRPQETLSLPLPSVASVGQYEVEVTGYYEVFR